MNKPGLKKVNTAKKPKGVSRTNSDESEKKYRFLFENLNDAVFLANVETGYILDANKEAENLLGRKHHEIIGMHQSNLHPKNKEINYREKFKEHVQKGRNADYEGEIIRKDGRVVQVNISAASVKLGGKKFIIGIFRDITEKKNMEFRKDEFINIASHELKTPITTIKAYSQILEKRLRERGDNKNVYFISNIISQIDRMVNLINDLLDSRKIEAGKLILNMSAFYLDALINEIAIDLQYSTDSHKIITETQTNIEATADRDRIGQVIINLITNAIKYSPNSDKVIIRATSEKGYAIVGVQDFGIGIPRSLQRKIFKRFFRVDGEEKKGISGFGLGLYISSEIIKRHHGKIWVESRQGKGSTFYFKLPLNFKNPQQF